MRIPSLAILAVLAAGTALAASSPETATYVDGNVTGLTPKTGGTLVFSGEEAMNFRTGLANIAVPYSKISHAELGAVIETSKEVPLYKIWALHKRFGSKPQDQYLIVNFTGEQGEEKSMTLSLAQASAADALATIQRHTGVSPESTAKTEVASSKKSAAKAASKVDVMKAGPADSGWWGEDVWKTTRNADKWGKPAGSTTAPDQQ